MLFVSADDSLARHGYSASLQPKFLSVWLDLQNTGGKTLIIGNNGKTAM